MLTRTRFPESLMGTKSAADDDGSKEDYAYVQVVVVVEEEEEEEGEMMLAACGCEFYRNMCFGRRRSKGRNGLRGNLLQKQQRCNYSEELGAEYRRKEEEEEDRSDHSWWVKRGKKLKETKWKSLIRELSSKKRKRSSKVHFQYDPQSYALNFDSGDDCEEDDGSGRRLDFAARFAAPARPVGYENSGIKVVARSK